MKNNRGSALILVIICISIVSILSASILLSSVTNRNMKLVDEKAKDNFYSTESGIDIFLANLQQMSEEVLGEEYTYVLTHYAAGNDEVLKKRVLQRMYEQLTGHSTYVEYEKQKVMDAVVAQLFSGTAELEGSYRLLNLESAEASVEASIIDNELHLSGLSLIYQENGYETKITTGVKLSVEGRELDIETPVMTAANYEGFVIIADQSIRNSLTATSLRGKVYTGGSLTAEHFPLTLSTDLLIVRDAIQTRSSGSIFIAENMEKTAAVWASNLMTTGGSTGQQISISDADCYIADDLVLGADASNVTIRGSYFGYGCEPGAADAGESSAITINASDAVLDLSGLQQLWVAGRSYLSVPSLYGANGTASYTEIMEGETISYKGNQLAYLVPAECIVGYEHNPLTKKEYDQIQASGGIAGVIDTELIFGENGGMNLKEYTAAVPCEAIPVRFMSETEPLYYLYLNFRNARAAEQYFLKYSEVKTDEMQEYAGVLSLGDCILPSSELIRTNGAVLRVSDHKIEEVIAGTLSASEAMILQAELRRSFSSLTHVLMEQYNGSTTGTVVENIVRLSEVEKLTTPAVYTFDSSFAPCSAADAAYQVMAVNGDLTLTSRNLSGILIVNGDVELSGCSFQGLILSTGTVELNQDKLSAVNEDGTDFVGELLEHNTSIQKYFLHYPLQKENGETESAESTNITISLENWYKN